jgi:DNA polymerase (family 10)
VREGYQEEGKMELEKAKVIAEELKGILAPACNRIEIAGSIRRQKPEVGDIELLVIPRANYLDKLLYDLMMRNILAMRLNKRGSKTYGPKNKLLLHVSSGIGVDIFSVDARNWGMALFVRTGPAEWNIKAMSRFQELGLRGHAYGGISDSGGNEIDCPDEETVFRYLGWAYVPPERRE